jgi:hypothetical protein
MIEIYKGTMGEFFLEFLDKAPHIVWFDNDWSLSTDLEDDLLSIGSRLPQDSFLFLTVSAEPPSVVRKLKPKDRHAWFRDQLGAFTYELAADDFQDRSYRLTSAKVVLRMIKYGFNARFDGKFLPFMKLLYKDSAWMMTVGGVFGEEIKTKPFHKGLRTAMPFLPQRGENFYQVPQFNVTDAERRLLDKIATQPRTKRRERLQAGRLGFDHNFLREYTRLVRYIPRYVESFV